MALAAVVVCHNQSNHLGEIASAFAKQKTQLDYVVLVSEDGQVSHDFENQLGNGVTVVQVASKHSADFDESVLEGIQALPIDFSTNDDNWFWLLSNRAVPQPGSLDQLHAKLETSVSAAIIAPKIMDGEQPRIIREMGLSLTPRSSVFVPVSEELDQGQHDLVEDVLAASLEGALVSFARIQKAGSFALKFAGYAADIELAVRLRLSGFRVIVAPSAKVNQFGEKRKSPRFADMQLKLLYWPLWSALLFALFLPVLVSGKSVLLLLRKQPETIVPELGAGLRAFFTAPAILFSRRQLNRKQRLALANLRVLYANRDQVRTKQIETRHYANLQTTSILTIRQTEVAPNFWASGAGWLAVLLVALNWQFWPAADSVSGPGMLTLGSQWLELFARTGASWQPLANGFFAPSDPFNWVLLVLGSTTFWSPSLSVALLFFLAKALAFTAAWRTLTLVTQKFWQITLAALAYAYWPAFTQAQTEGRLSAVITFLLLPWFVFALAKTLGFSTQNATRASTWSWLALAALLAAALSASAPSLAPLVAAAVFGLGIYRYKKLGYLIWLPVPMAVIWLPTVWYLVVGLAQPAALFTDPGVPLASTLQSARSLLLGGAHNGQFATLASLAIAVILSISLIAPWRSRSSTSLFLWMGIAVSVMGAWVFQQVRFVANGVVGVSTGESYVNGSPYPLLAVAALLAVILLARTLQETSSAALPEVSWRPAKLLNLTSGLLASLAVTVLVSFSVVSPSQLTYQSPRVVPAIIEAEALQHSQARMLVLRPQTDSKDALHYTATIVEGDGIQQADLSVNYRYTLSKLTTDDDQYAKLAAVTANLIAANDSEVLSILEANRIGYILVPADTNFAKETNLLSNDLDSSSQLSRVGTTEFGNLWKVNLKNEIAKSQRSDADYWSVTKSVQVAVLMIFVLLALPTRRRNQTVLYEDEFDVFEPDDSNEVAK